MKRSHGNIPWSTCPHCGKRAYVNRDDAKRAARRGSSRDGDRLRAYRCHYDGTHWHLGHLSWAARTGKGARPRFSTTPTGRVSNG